MIRSEDEKEISDEYITKGFRMVRLGVKTKRGRPTNTWKLAVTKNLKRLKRESIEKVMTWYRKEWRFWIARSEPAYSGKKKKYG